MKLLDFIVCDDIRQEVNNKFTLAGIYDNITFNLAKSQTLNWPLKFKLGFFIRILTTQKLIKADSCQIDFIYKNKTFFSPKVGPIKQLDKNKIIALVLNIGSFPLQGEGLISFKIKFFKANELIEEMTPDYKMNVSVNQKG